MGTMPSFCFGVPPRVSATCLLTAPRSPPLMALGLSWALLCKMSLSLCCLMLPPDYIKVMHFGQENRRGDVVWCSGRHI